MTNKITYLIGVDGGGTGTRVAVADCNGIELARGSAGPSGLINGADFAWNSILSAITAAFLSVDKAVPAFSQMAIGLGLAGVHNKQWAALFAEKNPGFARLELATDAYTTVLGAHQGCPGGMVAIGTGSVGEALLADGSRCEVGGWGFPCGDEAGGAWLGLRAVNHVQQVVDGRAQGSAFSDAVIKHCGGNRDGLFAWLAAANQGSYAQLAPLVIVHANQEDNPVVEQIMQEAGLEIVKIALALDKTNTLPIALCGGLAKSLEKYLPASLLNRIVPPHGDSAAGALLLIKKS
ncbi:BadF/BadG/BcrA/BcrD ATPase family protein [Solimicrobium silvestre]|uniref:Putative N-acetylglucosamine kinase n=1 Tax=Solimicrobium silvestre TaxID=2099400 RepID=A0A2S9H3F2_9BURK|nr:BadF/BadG/BcrA/BcrD ATPase family protein [Solimicrobium silvestre]PRC94501.1 putative N-acetylglucosamine kinase [Solimicrobium silvestre]